MAGIYDAGGWYGADRPDFPPKHVRDAIDAAGSNDGIYDDGGVYGPNGGPDRDGHSGEGES